MEEKIPTNADRRENWTNRLRECLTSDQLREEAEDIAKEMVTDPPDQSTILIVMSALKADPCWNGTTNPFLNLAQNLGKMDTASVSA